MSYTTVSNQSLNVNTSQTQISIQNNYVGLSSKITTVGSSGSIGEVSIGASSSYCDIINQSLANSGSSTSNLNCSTQTLIQKTAISQVAVTGANGNTCFLGSSQSVTISFYQTPNQQLNVSGLTTPISIWIPRTANLSVSPYQQFTASSLASYQCLNNDVFMQTSFTLSNNNSIHVQFKPNNPNPNLGYLALLKFGSAPKLNSTAFSNYDQWKLFCPNDTTTQQKDTFFLFFVNMTIVNGFSGMVGFAVRELTSGEMASYCPNNVNAYTNSTPPVLAPSSLVSNSSSNSTSNSTSACKIITNDLSFRVYLSGCYYLDTSTGNYKTDGADVLVDTNIYGTHCAVYHLTEFAGGFVVLPATINFESVFSGDSASIAKNPILYATVFTIIGLYVALAIICRLMDMRDYQKKGLTLLNNNRTENLYEIIVFTGNRRNAATDSNVFMLIIGTDNRSDTLMLKDPKRKVFRRGGVDIFIISADKYEVFIFLFLNVCRKLILCVL
jgi:hypothetical protein